jgi:hypothetical protein
MFVCVSSYLAYMDDDISNQIEFAFSVFFDYPGPCFLQLPRIIGALLYY